MITFLKTETAEDAVMVQYMTDFARFSGQAGSPMAEEARGQGFMTSAMYFAAIH